MRFCVLVLVYFATSLSVLPQELSKSDQREVAKIFSNYIGNATICERYCVFGDHVVPNLGRRDDGQPSEAVSNFLLVVDSKQKFRRHSSFLNVWNSVAEVFVPGNQWYSRVVSNGKTYSGFESHLAIIDDPKSLKEEPQQHGLKDFDPWALAFGMEGGYFPGNSWNLSLRDLLKEDSVVAVSKSKIGPMVTIQVGEGAQILVLFSEKLGLMPVTVEHRLKDSSVQANYRGEEEGTADYSWLIYSTSTRWKQAHGVWFPCVCTVSKYATRRKNPSPASAFEVELNWVLDPKDIDKLELWPSYSEELIDWISLSSVTLPSN